MSHTCRDRQLVPPLVFHQPGRDLRKYFQQVALDEVCFGHGARNIAAVVVPIAEL